MLPDIQPGNTKILYFFNCLLDGMHTTILIRSDLSLEELDAYYSRYRSNEWECLVKIQEGQSIEGIDHGTLQFAEEIKDRGYYIVYSWGSGNSLLDELDIRGH